MGLINKLFKKDFPELKLPEDPIREKMYLFTEGVESSMSEYTKQKYEELLSHLAGEMDILRYQFCFMYVLGRKDERAEKEENKTPETEDTFKLKIADGVSDIKVFDKALAVDEVKKDIEEE